MKVHVLAGDSLVAEFNKAKIDGDVVVCRECLVNGPIDADTLDEFWNERGRFILAGFGEDEIEYHERVADQLTKLTELTADAEVYLWFEYELFCSVNMWFCLWLLNETGAAIYRVEPVGLAVKDRWLGFGPLDAAGLNTAFKERTRFTNQEIKLGTDLWNAYRKNNLAALAELSRAKTDCFPFLAEVCKAAIVQDTKPAEILKEIIAEGMVEFSDAFPEFARRAGIYGYGDAQVEQIFDQLSS